MVTTPLYAPGSYADQIRKKNELAKAAPKAAVIPPASATPAVMPKGVDISGPTAASKSPTAITPTPQTPVVTPIATPKPVVTTPAPVPVSYGAAAQKNNVATPGYLDNRNTQIATDLTAKGVKDITGIQAALMQNPEFASASPLDQQNTVNEIFKKISTPATVTTPATPGSTSTGDPAFDGWLDITSRSAGYKDYADYKAKTGQSLDQLKDVYTAAVASGNTDALTKLGESTAAGLRNFSQAMNQSEARITAAGTKFKNGTEILQNMESINKAINDGHKTPQDIALATGLDAQLVTDLMSGDPKDVDKHLVLSDEAQAKASADVQRTIDYNTAQYNREKAKGQSQLEQLSQDYATNYSRQQTMNKNAEDSLSILARMTGVGFSSSGIHGMNDVFERGQQVLDDMTKNYNRSADSISNDLTALSEAYVYNNDNLVKSLNDQIDAAKNAYFSTMENIKSTYGDSSSAAVQQVNDAMVKFGTDTKQFYTDAHTKMMDNLSILEKQYNIAKDNAAVKAAAAKDTLASYKDNGLNMTPSQILADTTLSPQQQQMAIQQQQTSAINMLNQLSVSGIALPNDIARLQTLLGQPGVTPLQAISTIAAGNKYQYRVLTDADKSAINKNIEAPVAPLFPTDEKGNMTPQGEQAVADLITQVGKKTNYQCGAATNCYIEGVTGTRGTVGDTYQSKVDQINALGASSGPVVGGLFAFQNSETDKYGHIGVVTKVNPDGSFDVVEANRTGTPDGKGTPPQKGHYNTSQGKVFSQPPVPQKAAVDIETKIKNDPSYRTANEILNGNGDLSKVPAADYQKVQAAMGEIKDSRTAGSNDEQLNQLMDSASYGKDADATTLKQIQDQKFVIQGLDSLTSQLKGNSKTLSYTDADGKKQDGNVGPIIGLLRAKNPWDVDAQTVAAQVNALAPKVARGVFGEVGVLTDQDIARYLKTIPNLKQTSDVSSIVGGLLKMAVYKSFVNTVVTQAQGGRNMANFVPDYKKAKDYLTSVGVSSNAFDMTPADNSSGGNSLDDAYQEYLDSQK